MSISLLQDVATQTLPLNIYDKDQMDELVVLREAGLIAAFQVRSASNPLEPDGPMMRILAVTCEGRRLLQRQADIDRVE